MIALAEAGLRVVRLKAATRSSSAELERKSNRYAEPTLHSRLFRA
jgi:hypothetical protein